MDHFLGLFRSKPKTSMEGQRWSQVTTDQDYEWTRDVVEVELKNQRRSVRGTCLPEKIDKLFQVLDPQRQSSTLLQHAVPKDKRYQLAHAVVNEESRKHHKELPYQTQYFIIERGQLVPALFEKVREAIEVLKHPHAQSQDRQEDLGHLQNEIRLQCEKLQQTEARRNGLKKELYNHTNVKFKTEDFPELNTPEQQLVLELNRSARRGTAPPGMAHCVEKRLEQLEELLKVTEREHQMYLDLEAERATNSLSRGTGDRGKIPERLLEELQHKQKDRDDVKGKVLDRIRRMHISEADGLCCQFRGSPPVEAGQENTKERLKQLQKMKYDLQKKLKIAEAEEACYSQLLKELSEKPSQQDDEDKKVLERKEKEQQERKAAEKVRQEMQEERERQQRELRIEKKLRDENAEKAERARARYNELMSHRMKQHVQQTQTLDDTKISGNVISDYKRLATYETPKAEDELEKIAHLEPDKAAEFVGKVMIIAHNQASMKLQQVEQVVLVVLQRNATVTGLGIPKEEHTEWSRGLEIEVLLQLLRQLKDSGATQEVCLEMVNLLKRHSGRRTPEELKSLEQYSCCAWAAFLLVKLTILPLQESASPLDEVVNYLQEELPSVQSEVEKKSAATQEGADAIRAATNLPHMTQSLAAEKSAEGISDAARRLTQSTDQLGASAMAQTRHTNAIADVIKEGEEKKKTAKDETSKYWASLPEVVRDTARHVLKVLQALKEMEQKAGGLSLFTQKVQQLLWKIADRKLRDIKVMLLHVLTAKGFEAPVPAAGDAQGKDMITPVESVSLDPTLKLEIAFELRRRAGGQGSQDCQVECVAEKTEQALIKLIDRVQREARMDGAHASGHSGNKWDLVKDMIASSKTTTYRLVTECSRLAWAMVIQTPQMVLDTEVASEQGNPRMPFDRERHENHYIATERGKHPKRSFLVEFIAWPGLMTEGSPKQYTKTIVF